MSRYKRRFGIRLVRAAGFAEGCRVADVIKDIVAHLEGEPKGITITHQRRFGRLVGAIDAGGGLQAGTDQVTGFTAVHVLQGSARNLLLFCRQIQCLAAHHAPGASGARKNTNNLQARGDGQ